ncbi:MAG: DUF1549 domain-containing protein, partial [Planctomycetaceae bacterium]|nr:DUF1549 domain-containing protein [Planctomycetaceae bacterium]
MRSSLLWGLAVWSVWAQAAAAVESPTPEQLDFFEKRIRPVLVTHCYACHATDSPQVKGSLLLDTRAGVRRGGESGEIVVLGDPDASLLIKALKYADDAPAMPPRKQLSPEVIADFEKWVKLGAPDPREGAAATIRHEIDIEKGRKHWSFVAPREVPPPEVKDTAWPRTTIDRHLLAALERDGLKPVEDADPAMLVRRVYLDLVGLPPSPEETQTWIQKLKAESRKLEENATTRDSAAFSSQLSAFDSLLTSLLSSPRFGERWGRHWLDVARFAETSGRQINFNYPQAWRYRDWVIAALNADLPYDEFVRQQLAGDLLPATNDEQRAQQLIATGFLAIGPKPHSERDPLQFEMDLVDEQIDVTTQAFLGLTVACARCHDHKFDPVPQRDYYALAGVFRSTETCYGTIRIIQSLNPTPLHELPANCAAPSALPQLSSDELGTIKQKLHDVKTRYDER